MQVGDLVWHCHWETYGIIIKDFGSRNHHVDVMIGDEIFRTSKTRLEAVCK